MMMPTAEDLFKICMLIHFPDMLQAHIVYLAILQFLILHPAVLPLILFLPCYSPSFFLLSLGYSNTKLHILTGFTHQKKLQFNKTSHYCFTFTTVPSKSLIDGALVRTDRGDMVAYNLSSLAKLKESNGQISRLQDVASMFGPAVSLPG